MVRIAVATLLAFAVTAFAVGDPAGAANVGNGKGKQFITGACLSNADCASGCCAGLGDGAVCSGPAVGNAAGKRGCGFPDVGGPGAAAAAPKKQEARPAVGDPAGAANVGNGKGKQFITGACLSNADCASGCCAGLGDGAVCSGPAVGNAAGKRGCGFPDVGGPGAAAAAPKKQTARPAGCPPCARGFE